MGNCGQFVKHLTQVIRGKKEKNPGGTPGNSWWGCAARLFQNNISLDSDLPQKINACSQ